MKLIDETKANQNIILPFVGEQMFDEKGIIEVKDKDLAKQLLDADVGLRKVGQKVEEAKPAKGEDAESNEGDGEKKDDTPPEKTEAEKQAELKEQAIANIKKMTVAQMKEIAIDSGIPEEDLEGKLKADLQELLISKIS